METLSEYIEKQVDHRTLKDIGFADFEDTNDGRGATLFGMMILVVVTGVFWFAVGFAIGRMS